jgi:hypothetical protein
MYKSNTFQNLTTESYYDLCFVMTNNKFLHLYEKKMPITVKASFGTQESCRNFIGNSSISQKKMQETGNFPPFQRRPKQDLIFIEANNMKQVHTGASHYNSYSILVAW